MKFILLVLPGVLEVLAAVRPIILLIKVLLPTFDLPKSAISLITVELVYS